MRVLLLDENDEGYNFTVKEVLNIGYSDVIYKVYEDEDHIEFASGLFMMIPFDGCIYLEGVSKAECDLLCEKMLLDGYLDLRKYGTFLYADSEE